MATRLVGVLLMLVVVCALGCTSADVYRDADFDFGAVKRVAVIDVQGNIGRGEGYIADMLTMGLLKKGYKPLERSQMQALLKEQDFAASDRTTADGAARAGRILNVDAAMMANVMDYGDDIALTLKMVDVETGQIVWSASASATTGGNLGTIAGAALGAGAGVALGGSSSGRIFVGAVGGTLGGVAGKALTPRQDTQLRKALEKAFAGLPGG